MRAAVGTVDARERPHLLADLAEGLRFAWARPELMGTCIVDIVALGFAPGLPLALVCLAVAGAADMASGVFRGTIWNQTIPNPLRGRLAGIEMISYPTGPLVGNARAGFMAEAWGVSAAVWIGGAICLAGVVATGFALPRFWAYRSAPAPAAEVVAA